MVRQIVLEIALPIYMHGHFCVSQCKCEKCGEDWCAQGSWHSDRQMQDLGNVICSEYPHGTRIPGLSREAPHAQGPRCDVPALQYQHTTARIQMVASKPETLFHSIPYDPADTKLLQTN